MPAGRILFHCAAFMAGFLLVDWIKGRWDRAQDFLFADGLAALAASLVIHLVSRLRSAQSYGEDEAA